ncbi:phytoene dehydrogenase [Planctomycetales bacterium]|nr:phytoene dehydrogenase [Planctomycetales bacterium]GHV22556.1 phytoene dehydrogenase [Planctomycetales bacterium]
MNYDAIIIGAGLSGLATGIRLGLSGKKALILEAHTVAGGLNSYYRRGERTIDVGLHAMTNFAPAGAHGEPLTKLLRQLRLRHADLDLVEQNFSAIVFPSRRLRFTNNFADFRAGVAADFPRALAGFDALTAALNAYDDTASTVVPASTREKLAAFIPDETLREMLLCPLMYYGNAAENDMDWTQFATMWKAVFRGGFCRPRAGMKKILELLVAQFIAGGGTLRYGAKVARIVAAASRAEKVELTTGEEIAAPLIFSSAGAVETAALCGINNEADGGRMGFAELVLYLREPVRGDGAAITFFSQTDNFIFNEPADFIDDNSGVICCPNNFNFTTEPSLRVTARANFDRWENLDRAAYLAQKKDAADRLLRAAEKFYPALREKIVWSDLFTPRTVARFTGRYRGAIYGAPVKRRDGKTALANLYLIGTDQGFLGIVGALLSGISIANRYGMA